MSHTWECSSQNPAIIYSRLDLNIHNSPEENTLSYILLAKRSKQEGMPADGEMSHVQSEDSTELTLSIKEGSQALHSLKVYHISTEKVCSERRSLQVQQ